MINFKERKATKYVVVLITNTNCRTFEDFYRKKRREGELDTGCHYFVDTYGEISKDRKLDCVAGWEYKDNAESIYIVAQSETGKLNSCQQNVLPPLKEMLLAIYPEAIYVERT